MSESAQKCENDAIFKQNYTQKLFISLKYPILAVLALGEISNFQISSKNCFITSTTVLMLIPTPPSSGGRDTTDVHQRKGHHERASREAEGHDRVLQGPLR